MFSRLPARVPRKTLSSLRGILIPEGVADEASLQLIVTIDSNNVNVRELAAYLTFIDEVYGRLTNGRLDSYVQRREEQLNLTSFRSGSVEMVFSEFIANSDKVSALVIIFFLLKYFPSGIRDIASAYHEYQQGAEIRERRKPLRDEIKRDTHLAELTKGQQNQMVQHLDGIYTREKKLLLRSRRFSIEHVQKITLQLEQDSQEQEISKDKPQ